MKTLTPCELLRVTDGCISVWESQTQYVLHISKACHNVYNQVVFVYTAGYLAARFPHTLWQHLMSEIVMLL